MKNMHETRMKLLFRAVGGLVFDAQVLGADLILYRARRWRRRAWMVR
jgi:hypothetical protein